METEKRTPFRFLIFGAILLTGFSATLILQAQVERWERERLQIQFEKLSELQTNRFRKALQRNMDVLYSIRNLFHASQKVEKAEFRSFVAPLLAQYPDIFSLEWLPRITESQRVEFENRVRLEDEAGFRITEYSGEELIPSETGQEEYFPTFYIEPLTDSNRLLLGYNHASDPDRLPAMERARDSNAPLSTKIIPLHRFQQKDALSDYGFIVFIPVYEQDKSLNSVENRRRYFRGFIASVFHLKTLARALFEEWDTKAFDLFLYSDTLTENNTLVYASVTSASRKALYWRREFGVAGQNWTLVTRSRPEFFEIYSSGPAQKIPVAGFFLTLLFAILVFSLDNYRMKKIFRKLSLIDELTGLYNRRAFLMLLEQQIRFAQRKAGRFCLMLLDVDFLKKINDTFGHQEGDHALQVTADLLRKSFRKSDLIARLGGDEFSLMADETSHDDAEILIRHLQKNLRDWNGTKQLSYEISLSIGIAHFDPEKTVSMKELLAEADQVLYENKKLRSLYAWK